MRVFGILAILLVLVGATSAQDAATQIVYNEPSLVEFQENGEQALFEFEGQAGDLVYVQAVSTDDEIFAQMEIDLRDAAGASFGFKGEDGLDPFILADISADGVYTLAITYLGDEPAPVQVLVGKTVYLQAETGVATLNDQSLPVLFGLDVDADGTYTFNYSKTSTGVFDSQLYILDFSGFFPVPAVSVDGLSPISWSMELDLKADTQYIVFLQRQLFAEVEGEAEFTLSVEAAG